MEKTSRFHSQTLISTTIPVHAGRGGFWDYPHKVDLTGKQKYGIICYVDVKQPPEVTRLDISFLAMDDMNFQKWKNGQPNTALVIVPRVISGGIIFSPSSSGLYHLILDNTYSVFTHKTVSVRIVEIWVEEKVEKPVEKPLEAKPPKEVGILRRFLSKLFSKIWYSRYVAWFVIYLLIQGFCAVIAIGMAYLLQNTLDLAFEHTIGYIATGLGGGAPVLLGIIFFLYKEKGGKGVTSKEPPSIIG